MSDFKKFTYGINTDRLPTDTDGPVFVMLADLHNFTYGPHNERLARSVIAERPDAVLVAGDMLVGNTESSWEPAVDLLRSLRAEGLPVFYGNGNHEFRMKEHPEIYGDFYLQYKNELEDLGVRFLENEKCTFSAGGLTADIYGYELPESHYRKFSREKLSAGDISGVLGRSDPLHYSILLAHNPVYFEAYAAWGADLTLSGHLHGGIVRIPGIGGLITPQMWLFPKYDAGQFVKDGRTMVVSRGLGTHTINIRIFNPPELSVIRLKGE